MNELKECPFCGSKAELMLASDNGWVVACQGECEAQTCSWVAPKNAIAAWNRRPTPENKVYAEWIADEYEYNRCSECGFEHDSPEFVTPYCPHCGACMEQEEEHD